MSILLQVVPSGFCNCWHYNWRGAVQRLWHAYTNCAKHCKNSVLSLVYSDWNCRLCRGVLAAYNTAIMSLCTLISNLPIPASRLLEATEKLIVHQQVTKFPAFYGTWRFITVPTTAHHLSISSGRHMYSAPINKTI